MKTIHRTALAACLIAASILAPGLASAQLGSQTPDTDIPAPVELKADDLKALQDYDIIDATSLTLEGRGWTDPAELLYPYRRLPTRARGEVTTPVWNLSGNTAGLAVRFLTDATTIAAVWDGAREFTMNHMPDTGISGLDLYVRKSDGPGREAWRYVATGRPRKEPTFAVLGRELPVGTHEYILFLPLYHRLGTLQICVAKGATIKPAPPRKTAPIVFYGTSITQGGCASRTGMCHPAILGRWLDREVINLGFSGSGKMEPIMAELISELKPAVLVLECLPNMNTPLVRERVAPTVKRFRQDHPDTPILLVENPISSSSSEQNTALREVLDQLKADGVTGLTLLPSAPQWAGPENPTVDGVHPTDLGYLRMAEAYHPILEKLLKAR